MRSLLVYSFIFLQFLPTVILAQKVKTEKLSNGITLKYTVNKNNPEVKDGPYFKYINKELIEEGTFTNGKRTGTLIYYGDTTKSKIYGEVNDTVFNGKWTVIKNKVLVSEIYFTNGVMDSVFGYYGPGKMAAKTVFNKERNGVYGFYYPNGKPIVEGKVKGEKLDGEMVFYFPNGNLHRKVVYQSGKLITAGKAYDASGTELDGGEVISGTGKCKTYTYRNSDPSTLTLNDYSTYLDGELDGKKDLYYKGEVTKVAYYQKGELISIEREVKEGGIWRKKTFHYDSPETKFSADNRNKILIMPLEFLPDSSCGSTFPGGSKTLDEILESNLVYPEGYKKNGVGGKVYTRFACNAFGQPIWGKIILGSQPALNKATMNCLKSLPPFFPPLTFGIPIEIYYDLPINFYAK